SIAHSLASFRIILKVRRCVNCTHRFDIVSPTPLCRWIPLPAFAYNRQTLSNFPPLHLQPRVFQERACKHRRHRRCPSNLLEVPDRFFAATGAQFALREIPSRKSASRLRGIARPLFQFVTWWLALGAVNLIQLGENLR